MSAIGASMGFFFTSASALKKMNTDKDSNVLFKVMAVIGVIFSVVFMILQLIPIPGLNGVHFGKESYLMLLIWIVIGIVFYFSKKRTISQETK
jgi:preprotein translocase subunit SecG